MSTPPVNSCNSSAGLIEKYINSAYDNVKSVADNLDFLHDLYEFLVQYGLTTNIAVKAPVQIVSTSPITLAGNQTISWSAHSGDYTIAAVTGNRVLVMGQTNPVENGIYNVQIGAWTRAVDFDGPLDVVDGTLVFSAQGDAWQVDGPQYTLIPGEDPITFRDIDLFAFSSVQKATAKAAEAAASAAAALVSENAAAVSASESATSASESATSAAESLSSAAAAKTSETNAKASETGAAASAMSAQEFATMAESVADNDRTFPTVDAGLAAVADGQYFRVIADNPYDEVAFTYYHKEGTVAVEKTGLTSAYGTDLLNNKVDDVAARTEGIERGSRYPFEIIDKQGKQAAAINSDGDTLVNGTLHINGVPLKSMPVTSEYSFAITDSFNKVAFGIGKDAFVEILGARISLTGGHNIIEIVDKEKRVAGGLTKNGVLFSNSSAPKPDGSDYPYLNFAERMHVPVYGQSLSVGSWGIPVLGTPASDSYMYNTGVRSYNVNPSSLVALRETASGNQGETICSGLAHDFVNKSGGMYNRKMIMNSSGVGGYSIEQLSKGTPPYNSMINQFTWLRNKMATEGTEYAMDFFCWMQGETNMANGTSYSDYQTKFKKLRSDIQADTLGSRDTGRDLVALTYQTSSHGYYVGTPENPPEMIAQAQLDMALTDPLIDMWGPTYMQDPANYIAGQGSVHHGPHGYRIQGLYASKALRHRLATRTADKPNGEKYLPVHATSAKKLNSNTVIVEVFTYHPPLVIDSSYVTELEDGMHGVELHDDTGRLPVTNVSIVGGTKIKVETSATIGSNPFIAFAWTPENRGEISGTGTSARYTSWFFGRVTGVRTTIHDSDPEVTDLPDQSGQPYPLYNYLPIQKIYVE
nr:MAG: carbohydrate esterase, sialic acid-specific acetylesterase protein [Bacteriophage sp.]